MVSHYPICSTSLCHLPPASAPSNPAGSSPTTCVPNRRSSNHLASEASPSFSETTTSIPLPLLFRFKIFHPMNTRLARASTPAMPAPAPMPIEVLVERCSLKAVMDGARELARVAFVVAAVGDTKIVEGGTVRGIGKAEASRVTPTLD